MNPKQQEIKVRFQASEGSLRYVLIEYIKKNWETPKEAILEALEACWLPLACQDYQQIQNLSSDKIKRIAQKSLSTLRYQIDWICEELDLENPYDLEEQLTAALANLDGQFLTQEREKEPDEPDYPNSIF